MKPGKTYPWAGSISAQCVASEVARGPQHLPPAAPPPCPAGSLFASVYSGVFYPDKTNFLLFLALAPVAVGLLALPWVRGRGGRCSCCYCGVRLQRLLALLATRACCATEVSIGACFSTAAPRCPSWIPPAPHPQVNHCSFVQKSELESGQHVFTAGGALAGSPDCKQLHQLHVPPAALRRSAQRQPAPIPIPHHSPHTQRGGSSSRSKHWARWACT